MRFVEGVFGELLPLAPYLFEHGGVVTSLHTSVDKHRLHLSYYLLLLLTHRLSQRVALSSCKSSQQSAEQHHLLLIDGHSVGLLKIAFHLGDVILYLFFAVLAPDEGGYLVHRPRSVEGVHGDQVFKHRGVQLAQVFLHAGRLKLEGADGATLLKEFVGWLVVKGNLFQVYVNAACSLDNLHRFLLLRQSLESEEVHLDEACLLYHVSVILSDGGLGTGEVGVIGGGHRHVVGDRVATDDESAGV